MVYVPPLYRGIHYTTPATKHQNTPKYTIKYTKIYTKHTPKKMSIYKQPYLKPYTTLKDSRTDCPKCGKKNCFTIYLSGDTNEPINSKVGICNHANSCGYHYTPKQFFIDNPTSTRAREKWTPPAPTKPTPPPPPMGTVPFEYVESSASYQSNFVLFLLSLFDRYSLESPTVLQLCKTYAIGATKAKEVVFWQIDTAGKVRTGKIMQYNPESGKRVGIDWTHSRLIKAGELPKDYNLNQCFFGEHLLKLKPSATVAIVESEKTAIIASGLNLMPNFIWLAAGNINGLSIEKAKVLTGRNVILYPDLGIKRADKNNAFEIWTEQADKIQKAYRCNVIVSDLLEKNATDADRVNGLDIADYLIKELRARPQPTTERENRFSEPLQNMVNRYPALKIFINRLNLIEV